MPAVQRAVANQVGGTQRAVGVTDEPSGIAVVEYRTRERTAAALNAVEQYLIPAPERVRSGVYIANTGRHALQAAAHAANNGFWFLVNPPGSGVLVAVREITYMMGTTSTAIAFANSPRTTLERFTYTGTPSGAQITPGEADNGQPAPQARLYTASTGMTITAGAVANAFLAFPGFSGGAVPGANTAQPFALRDGVGEWDFPTMGDPGTIVLAEGEGLLYRQADAGATSETASRTATLSLAWEEYTVP